MKINRISVKNFLGVRSLEIHPNAPVVMLCGGNAAGKSSTMEAIRAAMTGRIERVALKKEYGAMVSTGEKVGTVVVDHDGGRCGMTLPNGAFETEGLDTTVLPALPYALDAHLFASRDEAGRRLFLYDLLGIKTDPDTIAARLVREYECDAELVDQIRPMFASGFDAALKHAKEQASQSRGAWKATTGEAYGSEKAKKWAPAIVDAPTLRELNAAEAAAKKAERAAAAASQGLGAVTAELRIYRERMQGAAALRECVAALPNHRTRLERAQEELAVWSAKLASLPPEPGAVSLRPAMACPDCGAALTLRDGALHHHEAGPVDDEETALKREQWGRAVALHRSTIEHANRDILAAERAQAELDELDRITPVTPADREAATAAAFAAEREKAQAEADLAKLRDRKALAEARDGRIRAATKLYEEVIAWEAIAAALSPEGLRTRMVADAIEPVNRALASCADLAQWDVPQIGADMQIRVGGDALPYALLSKSEQWRVDALIAMTVAELSGIGLLLLDGFDILEVPAREDLICALFDLIEAGRIGQAIIAATLKNKPASTPMLQSVWIEREHSPQEAIAAT